MKYIYEGEDKFFCGRKCGIEGERGRWVIVRFEDLDGYWMVNPGVLERC